MKEMINSAVIEEVHGVLHHANVLLNYSKIPL